MKNSNPLYVVKGSTVLEAKGLFDMVLKKFNLEPAYEVMINILKMLLSQITSYPMFVAVKEYLDKLMLRVFGIVSKMSLTRPFA